MDDIYYSIEKATTAEFKEKGSKFLGYAFPVINDDEIKKNLKSLKEKYWDASHHCYAYILGPKGEVFRANDAGEPNHSAGDPILSQIKSLKLTDVLVVVVRYFGGTKLGVSGLISAYKMASRQALDKASIIEKHIVENYTVKFETSRMSLVMKAIKQFDFEIKEQKFDHELVQTLIEGKIRKSLEDLFIKSLEGTKGIKISRSL